MAINPMQRRARNSFIQGALISLLLMLVVVLFLVKQMNINPLMIKTVETRLLSNIMTKLITHTPQVLI